MDQNPYNLGDRFISRLFEKRDYKRRWPSTPIWGHLSTKLMEYISLRIGRYWLRLTKKEKILN
jgi:hypothetical protein